MIQGYTHEYLLQVDGQLYRISMFRLALTYGEIQQLSVVLPVGQAMNRVYNKSPLQLYTMIQQKAAIEPIQVVLHDQGAAVFTGILVGMNISIGSGESLCVTCQCLGMAAKLMYNPLADYIMIPKGCQSPVNIAKCGLGLYPQLRQPWSCVHGSMVDLYNRMQQKAGQTLQNMFQAAQTQLQNIIQKQLAGQKIDGYTKGPKISQFIKSQYKLGRMTTTNSSAKGNEPVVNSFIQGLCAVFLGQISSGNTIYQCLKDALGDDVFLQLVPSADGKYMYIVPTYQYKYTDKESAKLQASDIISIRPSVIASQFIKTPGTVYANFTASSDYGGKKDSKVTVTNYGKYSFTQSGAFKMLAGPFWCLNMITEKREQPGSNYTGQQDMDNIAKIMFFQRYGKGSTCILELAPTETVQKLCSCVGKAVCIQPANIKVDAVKADISNLGKIYGQLKQLSITYIAASDIQGRSSLRIQAGLDRFWSQKSKFSQLFKAQTSNQQLYIKV